MTRGRPPLHVSAHAIERFQERVENLPDHQVIERLTTPAIIAAAQFGCECHVRLPSGHRIIVKEHTVVTVTPRPQIKRCRTGKPQP